LGRGVALSAQSWRERQRDLAVARDQVAIVAPHRDIHRTAAQGADRRRGRPQALSVRIQKSDRKLGPRSTITGRDLQRLRASLHLSRQAIARELGIARTTIQHWERNDYPLPQESVDRLLARYGERWL